VLGLMGSSDLYSSIVCRSRRRRQMSEVQQFFSHEPRGTEQTGANRYYGAATGPVDGSGVCLQDTEFARHPSGRHRKNRSKYVYYGLRIIVLYVRIMRETHVTTVATF